MQDPKQPDNAARSGVATYVVEAIVAATVFLIGAVVAYKSAQLGRGWESDGPAAGYFPFYIGCILCIASARILYGALFGNNRNTEIFVDSAQLKLVSTVLVPSLVYVAAIQLIGIYAASALFIAGFMVVVGKFGWAKAVATGLAVVIVFFFMFEVWFKVPLYKGMFNPLRVIGY